jgi:hypothetical protein
MTTTPANPARDASYPHLEVPMRRLVFLACLLAVAMGGGWLLGQSQPLQRTPVQPGLFTGADIGIRVHGTGRDGKTYGTLVVRTSTGEWVEVIPGRPGGVVPLESRAY